MASFNFKGRKWRYIFGASVGARNESDCLEISPKQFYVFGEHQFAGFEVCDTVGFW